MSKMINLEDFYDDQGTYIFRKPEYPKVKMESAYKSVDEAKAALVQALDEVITNRQLEDVLYIQKGYKKTLARIAARLPEEKQEEAFKGLPVDVAQEVRHILKNEELEKALPAEYNSQCTPCDIHDLKIIIHDVSSTLPSDEIKSILKEKLSYDPEFLEELENAIFLFEDIIYLDDRAVQKILREIDQQELARALYDCDEKILHKFLRNLTNRAGRMLVEDIQILGKLPEEESIFNRYLILTLIRRLEDCGDLVIRNCKISDLV